MSGTRTRSTGGFGLAVIGGLIAAVVAAACGSSTPSRGAPTAGPTLSRDEVVTLLADAGIGVYAEYGSTSPVKGPADPVSPFRLTQHQAGNLARDLSSGGGVTGADLDALGALAGLPGDAPPFSYLVAGWVAKLDSSGAKAARRLMGDRDWTHPAGIIFPHVVLALFVSDTVRAATGTSRLEPPRSLAAPGTQADLGRRVAAAAPVSGVTVGAAAETVCAGVAGWVNSVLTTIFDVLKLDDSGSGVLATIAAIWNAAVDLAQQVVVGLVTELSEAAFWAVRKVIAAVASLSMAASLFVPYAVTWTPSPAILHLSHPGGGPATGSLTASVSDADVQWAAEILACAALAGVTMPDPLAAGKALTWTLTPLGDHGAAVTTSSVSVGADGAATLTYSVGSEDGTGPVDGNGVSVELDIEHLAPADLQKMFETIVLGGEAGQLFAQVLGDQLGDVEDKLASLMNQSSGGFFYLEYHRPEPTPSAAPTEPPVSASPNAPSATPFMAHRVATAHISYPYKGMEVDLEHGWCKVGPDEGGYWQLWFVGPGHDVFDIALSGSNIVGHYTDAANLISSIQVDAYNVDQNIKMDSLTLTGDGSSIYYTGPARGTFFGRIYDGEEDRPISGTFDCFGATPTPTPT